MIIYQCFTKKTCGWNKNPYYKGTLRPFILETLKIYFFLGSFLPV
jgi:hypothetical protein